MAGMAREKKAKREKREKETRTPRAKTMARQNQDIRAERTGKDSGYSLLPLKSDIVFKMVFGDPRFIPIIRAFLTVVLDIAAELFEDLKIIDPHLERDLAGDKLGILDVRVQLKDGKLIAVEIQVRPVPAMAERVTFSTSRNLTRQISSGESYTKIERAVTIVITDYDMIQEDGHYHHVFRLYDSEHDVLLTDVMEIHTLELNKLPESSSGAREEELLNWLRLIRSEREEEIAMLGTKTPEMGMAVDRLVRLSADERTRMLYEARELYLMDEMARREAAYAEGRAEGEALGVAKGMVEGEARGMAKGRAEGEALGVAKGMAEGEAKGAVSKALEIARKMLTSGLDIETVAQFSGLSAEELKALR
jgi:predicted transposase/invertase (TIGR01784 family)